MLIDVIAGLIAGVVTILQARTSTRIEIAASMELAELLVSEAVGLMQQEVPAEKFLFDLTSRLRLVRHVRIGVKDAQGSALAVPPSVGNADATRGERAPGWFAALIAAPISPARFRSTATSDRTTAAARCTARSSCTRSSSQAEA